MSNTLLLNCYLCSYLCACSIFCVFTNPYDCVTVNPLVALQAGPLTEIRSLGTQHSRAPCLCRLVWGQTIKDVISKLMLCQITMFLHSTAYRKCVSLEL